MPPPPSELRRLVDQGLSVDEICAHYGCSRSTLYRWFDQLNVTPPPRASWARTVSKEYLSGLYQQLETMEAIAEHEGVTKGQVERAMQHHNLERRRHNIENITRRRPGSGPAPARERPPADELRRVNQKRKSVRGVADHYGVGVRTAHEWLSDPEVGIQPRPPGRPSTRSPRP
jgi:transposase